MKIASVRSWVEQLPLSRPYTIAFRSIDQVENVIVELVTETGLRGLGAASPEPYVTGETNADCQRQLEGSQLDWLEGCDVRELTRLCRLLGERWPDTPAARAAVDIALHDLWAQANEVPLADLLGRAHNELPTSVTIGIKDAEETVAEAKDQVAAGFSVLKIKIGRSVEEDVARLHKVREAIREPLAIRVDANQGYDLRATQRFFEDCEPLDLEFVEQPIPVADTEQLRELPLVYRNKIAMDESLLNPTDAVRLAGAPYPGGIFNIKLMKCGGVSGSQHIARIAEAAGLRLMWGCMDESRISIAAALHSAFASPATRYLDLDGSFDLARDIVEGGFELNAGRLRTTEAPGLGVRRTIP